MYRKSISSVNDPEGVRPIDDLIGFDGQGEVNFDLDTAFLSAALDRLTLAECGLVSRAIARSVVTNERTIEQTALLVLFAHWGGK